MSQNFIGVDNYCQIFQTERDYGIYSVPVTFYCAPWALLSSLLQCNSFQRTTLKVSEPFSNPTFQYLRVKMLILWQPGYIFLFVLVQIFCEKWMSTLKLQKMSRITRKMCGTQKLKQL